MSVSADTLALLIEAGLAGDQLVNVVRSIEADHGPAQTSGAERQRRYRQRQKEAREGGDVTSDVTGDGSARDADPSPQSPPLKTPPDPLKITPPLTPQPACVGGRANLKFLPPEGVSSEQFKAFRQQRKKPLNERSYALLCSKLQTLAESGWPPGDMVDLAIERGWETVFEPKDQVPKNGQRNTLRGSRSDPLCDAYRRASEEERAGSDQEADFGAWTSLPAHGAGSA